MVAACAIVLARIRMAFVHLNVTIAATVSGRACAHKSGGRVFACAMGARFLGAHNCLLLAVTARPSFMAFALVRFLRGIIGAHATVQTRPILAVAHLNVAIGTGEPGLTHACVRALAGVVAGAAVLARPMIGAIIQILIAE